jgi:rsbT co-antagonist protein RsbR
MSESAVSLLSDPANTTHALDVNGYRLTWSTSDGTFQFSGLTAVAMWVDSTLAGLWTGMREMVGAERFGLALVKQGRESVAGDWTVIEQGKTFEDGLELLAGVAAAAGWGRWRLLSVDRAAGTMVIEAANSWEQVLAAGLGSD